MDRPRNADSESAPLPFPTFREDPSSFEQWAGLYVTGVLLVVFVGAHLWAVHYAAPSTEGYTFASVGARLRSPLYRAFDLSLLVLALCHGLIGVRRVIADLGICGPRALRLVGVVLTGCGIVGLVYGSMIFRALVG